MIRRWFFTTAFETENSAGGGRVFESGVDRPAVRLFGSSGIRGIANVDVTPDLAMAVGRVLGSAYGSTVVGRDPRLTGEMLASALIAGVLSSGADATDAGMVSTPTLARGASDYKCGVVITASHNPAPYNGIKLWNPDGVAFDEAQQDKIEAALKRKSFAHAAWNKAGARQTRSDLAELHKQSILAAVGDANLKVVVDCGSGATAELAPAVLKEMGCTVTALNAVPDGRLAGRDPEPTEENLELLRRKADFGGEPSGTWIFPRVTMCRDGVYAAAHLVSIVKETPLSELVAQVPQFPILRGAVPFPAAERDAVVAKLDTAMRGIDGKLETVDGWRVGFADGWFLVRPSGTEPKVRITAEARNERRAEGVYETALSQ